MAWCAKQHIASTTTVSKDIFGLLPVYVFPSGAQHVWSCGTRNNSHKLLLGFEFSWVTLTYKYFYDAFLASQICKSFSLARYQIHDQVAAYHPNLWFKKNIDILTVAVTIKHRSYHTYTYGDQLSGQACTLKSSRAVGHHLCILVKQLHGVELLLILFFNHKSTDSPSLSTGHVTPC